MAQSNSAQEAARRDLGEGRVLELRQLEGHLLVGGELVGHQVRARRLLVGQLQHPHRAVGVGRRVGVDGDERGQVVLLVRHVDAGQRERLVLALDGRLVDDLDPLVDIHPPSAEPTFGEGEEVRMYVSSVAFRGSTLVADGYDDRIAVDDMGGR